MTSESQKPALGQGARVSGNVDRLGSDNVPEDSNLPDTSQDSPAQKYRNTRYSSEFGKRQRATQRLLDLAFRSQKPW